MVAHLALNVSLHALIKSVLLITLFLITLFSFTVSINAAQNDVEQDAGQQANAEQVKVQQEDIQKTGPEQYQKIFNDGLALIDTDPSQSAEIFKQLYRQTKSTRVKLEWARALYASGQLDAAKQVFKEILNEDLPLPVRDRVEIFLADIDVDVRPLSLSFGLVSDSNPRASPKEQQVILFGQTFNYTPEIKPKSEFGLLTSLSYVSPQHLNGYAGLSAQLDNYDYPTKINDRTIAKVTVFRRLDAIKNLGVGLSYEDNLLGYRTLYHSPSLILDYFFEPKNTLLIGLNFKRSKITFPHYQYLDSFQSTYNFLLSKEISPYLKLFVEATHEDNNAEYAAYSFNGNVLGVGLKWGSQKGGLQITGKLSSAKREFGIDPFFAVIREDNRSYLSLTLTKRDFYVTGFRPSLEFFWEKNKSTIPIDAYQKNLVSMMFTKVF